MKYISLLMELVVYFFTFEINLGDICFTPLELVIVVGVAGIIASFIRNFFGS